MIRKLEFSSETPKEVEPLDVFVRFGVTNEMEQKFAIETVMAAVSTFDQQMFYPLVCEVLTHLGFNCVVTRSGDTNNRVDAFIIDPEKSIPIEIKSPTEVPYINNKSIRQAIENKTILLSRTFYKTTREITSLAIGYKYPAERSGVFDLVDDVKKVYQYNIGFISFEDLIRQLWKVVFKGEVFQKEPFYTLNGQFSEKIADK